MEPLIRQDFYPPPTRGRLVVWGLLAAYPFGGMTWQVLHHLVGLRRLGFDVWYVEESCRELLTPDISEWTFTYEGNIRYLDQQMQRIGLGDRWVFRPPAQRDTCLGARDLAGLRRLYKEADAIFNLCGAQEITEEHDSIRCLVYLQTDPVLDQVEVAKGNAYKVQSLERHNYLFTYGENIGEPDCLVPVRTFEWLPTRPPVVCEWWETEGPPTDGSAFTTVAAWQSKGKDIERQGQVYSWRKDVEWQGQVYSWRKDVKFTRVFELPCRVSSPLELALREIPAEDAKDLRTRGWRVVAATQFDHPERYRQYIRSSYGEFTVTKDQYVRMRTGWFSDRSVCYLAAGRPVVTEDTGFGKYIPTGQGIFAFTTEDEAVNAIRTISSDYRRHSEAAREIARQYFGANKVLGSILSSIGLM